MDDGCYLAVKVISELARRRRKGLSADVKSLYSGLQEPGQEMEIRLDHQGKIDFRKSGTDAIRCMEEWIKGRSKLPAPPGWTMESENYEGIRIKINGGLVVEEGWLLLRQSLHDPLLVLNIETQQKNGCFHVACTLAIWLEAGGKYMPGWRDVDLTKLKDVAKVVSEDGKAPIYPL